MATDSHLFTRRDKLETDGWYPVEGKRWKKGTAEAVPLYEGKMVQVYDHRAAHITVNPDNTFRAAQQRPTSIAEHTNAAFLAEPQYWVAATEMPASMPAGGCIAFKDVTSPTNMRTVIAAWIPYAGAGHTLPLLLPDEALPPERYMEFAPLLLANLNSFALDFLARQKVQGQHLMLYVLEQLPLIRPEQFEQSCSVGAAPGRDSRAGRAPTKDTTLADFVRNEVLRLSYTAHDLEPFARDMGYDGAPFKWDETDRLHRLARLDALFFNLYGINRDDAAYILDTFPIVREQDIKAHGRFLTKDLILAYMNAVAAGDFTTVVQV